jgi:hypothetical protein
MKFALAFVAMIASVSAFAPAPAFTRTSVVVYNEGPEL